ncbi:MAG TPA: FGGY-family carbohydrate kinase [Acidimicrobiales bacterium]
MGDSNVTVGLDIGTTSVKGLAVDDDGHVLAQVRVPHPILTPAADRFEHDANRAWRDGVRQAWRQVSSGLHPVGVNVVAMVPSLTAVDARGHALTPGLLYGDARGRGAARPTGAPGDVGELLGFLRWCHGEAPDAAGYWPAQAVANHALGGRGAMDSISAMTAYPLYDGQGWDEAMLAESGVTADRLPDVVNGDSPVGEIDGAAIGPGGIDAFGEQLVAGAEEPGDVLVICGTTLITWAVTDEWVEVPGLWTIPHSSPGRTLIGGPSNAGGLFLNWATHLLARGDDPRPDRIPVWSPYVRGERTPLHDPDRRSGLDGLDLTQGPAALRRAAFEAAGFVVRHHLDLAGVPVRRLVLTGGGVRVSEWVQALADCTGLPADVVSVPEGGALGSAFFARLAAGLETDATAARRWAHVDHRVEPDPAWVEPCARRYARFRELADA